MILGEILTESSSAEPTATSAQLERKMPQVIFSGEQLIPDQT